MSKRLAHVQTLRPRLTPRHEPAAYAAATTPALPAAYAAATTL
jgi:hypothetical protein